MTKPGQLPRKQVQFCSQLIVMLQPYYFYQKCQPLPQISNFCDLLKLGVFCLDMNIQAYDLLLEIIEQTGGHVDARPLIGHRYITQLLVLLPSPRPSLYKNKLFQNNLAHYT